MWDTRSVRVGEGRGGQESDKVTRDEDVRPEDSVLRESEAPGRRVRSSGTHSQRRRRSSGTYVQRRRPSERTRLVRLGHRGRKSRGDLDQVCRH